MSTDHRYTEVSVPGQDPPADGDQFAFLNAVSPDWFSMFGMPLLTGRGFDDRDQANAELVAIVNEAFARKFAAQHTIVGESMQFGSGLESPRFRIIGLVRDTGAAIYYGLREE